MKAGAQGLSIEAYLATLIEEDANGIDISEPDLEPSDPEFEEIQAAVLEGMRQADRAETRPAEQVFSELRAKHGVSR